MIAWCYSALCHQPITVRKTAMHKAPIRLFVQLRGDVIEIIDEEIDAVQERYLANVFTEEQALAEYKAKYLNVKQ